MEQLSLAKYEALGNDFLIVFDGSRELDLPPSLVSALCDRHRGIGADGLIHLRPSNGTFAMVLTNADGSFAETSGNGLRCAALAAFDAGLVAHGPCVITTVNGRSEAVLVAGGDGVGELSVEMGRALVEPVESPMPGRSAFRVDVGNPHLVLIGDRLDDVDIAVLGPPLEAARPGGQNVEFVARSAKDELDFLVYERGAGVTEACGSGSVAAAAAARLSGVVGDVVAVHNPGGTLVVELSGADASYPATRLIGPARRVAELVVHLSDYRLEPAVSR